MPHPAPDSEATDFRAASELRRAKGARFPRWAGRLAATDRSRIRDTAEIRSLPVPPVAWTLLPVAVRPAVIHAVAHCDYAQPGAPLTIPLFDHRLEIPSFATGSLAASFTSWAGSSTRAAASRE